MLSFLLTLVDDQHRDIVQHIYDMYHDDMIRFARHRLKSAGLNSYEVDAEDVVQNAFLKIVKYIDAIDLSRPEKQLKAYVFSIVANETKNVIADREAFDNIDTYFESLSDEDFFAKLQIHIRYDDVVEKIKGLDEKYSITLFLYYVQKTDVKTIAKIMGIAEKTVYTRLERGKRLLLDAASREKKS